MLMNCIDRRGARVRRGCAGDAGSIVKQPQRGTRASPDDPKGRVLNGLGRRPALLRRHQLVIRLAVRRLRRVDAKHLRTAFGYGRIENLRTRGGDFRRLGLRVRDIIFLRHGRNRLGLRFDGNRRGKYFGRLLDLFDGLFGGIARQADRLIGPVRQSVQLGAVGIEQEE